jgi:four helix bundle protein
MPTSSFRELEVWKQSMDLVVACYELTKPFPASERFGLVSEIRRAAVSIPSNVAEGYCRRTTGAYAHHVSISLGSHGELDTQMEAAERLGYLPPEKRQMLVPSINSVGRLLNGLYNSLEQKLQHDTHRRR